MAGLGAVSGAGPDMPMENLSVSSIKPIGEPIRVLLVEDNPIDAELVVRALRAAGFEPTFTRVDTEEAYLRELDGHPELILSDWSMPQFDGLRALNLLRGRGMDMPFIIVSGSIGEETAVTAMRHGASDYLLKDRLVRLGQAVRQALGQGRASQERREAAARLQASEDRLRSVVETISDVIWVAEPGALRPTFLGPAFETVWGRPRADFLAGTDMSVLDTVHQEDRAIFVRAVAEQAAGHATGIEYRILRPDGEVRWIRDEGFPVRDASGRVTTINGIASDITDRKRTEEELRRRTAFFGARSIPRSTGSWWWTARARRSSRTSGWPTSGRFPPNSRRTRTTRASSASSPAALRTRRNSPPR